MFLILCGLMLVFSLVGAGLIGHFLRHCRMKSRDNTSAVIKALRKEHGLLAAFLEAADKIDCRVFNRRTATAKPINVEAPQASAAPISSQVAPLNPVVSPLIFRRANLTRASE